MHDVVEHSALSKHQLINCNSAKLMMSILHGPRSFTSTRERCGNGAMAKGTATPPSLQEYEPFENAIGQMVEDARTTAWKEFNDVEQAKQNDPKLSALIKERNIRTPVFSQEVNELLRLRNLKRLAKISVMDSIHVPRKCTAWIISLRLTSSLCRRS